MAGKHSHRQIPSLVATPNQSFRGVQTSQRGPVHVTMHSEEVLEDSDTYSLRAKNWSVPVKVQEEIVTPGNVLSSGVIGLHGSGWVIFVTQKRAYLWRQSSDQGPSGVSYQLSLSPTALKWTSSLIDIHSMFPHTPSSTQVLAVSPEGIASFWKNILHESPDFSLKLELSGDTVHSVKKLQGPDGYVLLTASGSLLMINTSVSQPLITVIPVGHQSHAFSGFGKRLSSLFFGGGTKGLTNSSVKMVTWNVTEQSYDILFILTSAHLQCWKIYSSLEMDQMMLLDFDVLSMIKADFQDLKWVNSHLRKMRLLDMQATCEGLMILFGASMDSSAVLYGIAVLPLYMESPPYSCTSIVQLPLTNEHQDDAESVLLDVSMEGSHSSSQLSVYTGNLIIPIHCSHLGNVNNAQKISFPEPNLILGSGIFEGDLLFFTKQHGVISLSAFPPTPSASPPKKIKSTYVTSGQTLQQLLTASTGGVPTDGMERETEQFQQAFLLYLGNNMAEAVDLCSQLFPVSSFAGGVNTPGDICSIRLSEMILNDVPASDPRWNKTDTLGSYSLIILNQLQDKQKAHRKLIQFLIDMELLNLLTCVTLRGSVLLTRNVLCENSEKIAASIALRENQSKDVEEAAKIVVQKRSPLSQIRPGLTTQDVFYSQVSLIDEIFPPLIQTCESFSATGDMVGVTRIAFIIKSMLSGAIQYRTSHVDLYTSSRPVRRVYHTEFIPWTACEEMLHLLRRLLSSMLDQWAACDDQPISDIDQESFWSVYSDLASILFTGSSDLYDSIKDHKDNEHRILEVYNSLNKDKDHFIILALNLGRVGMALQLAEEWSHFPTILQVFEEQGDTEMLRNYLEVFKDQGFDEFIFHYYIDNKNIKQLIELTNLFPESLSKFLNEYPELQWLHLIATDKYNEASESLRRVSDNEETFLSRKKTALSLSKLALLATGGHSSAKTAGELEDINCELQRIEYVEKLPENSLKKIGAKNINDLPPLPPKDVIKLFLEGEDNQLMYTMIALNYLLLAYPDLESEERRQLQVLIWSHVVLQTNWSEFNTDGDIMEELQGSLMFRLMNECHHNFPDVKQLLPAIEDLLSSQLLVDKGLDSSAILIYCVKLCYERVTELQR